MAAAAGWLDGWHAFVSLRLLFFRAQALEPLLEVLGAKAYTHLHKELSFELGEVYQELADIKVARCGQLPIFFLHGCVCLHKLQCSTVNYLPPPLECIMHMQYHCFKVIPVCMGVWDGFFVCTCTESGAPSR